MNAKRYASIPSELFYWITSLSQALLQRSIVAFIGLLIAKIVKDHGAEIRRAKSIAQAPPSLAAHPERFQIPPQSESPNQSPDD